MKFSAVFETPALFRHYLFISNAVFISQRVLNGVEISRAFFNDVLASEPRRT